MSTLPVLLNLANDLDRLSMAVSPIYPEPPSAMDFYRWPNWSQLSRLARDTTGPVSHIGKDGFQVSMDVTQFKPSELTVKVVENSIVVEAKHEEREDDHGYISRHFVRRYALPKGYDASKVVSTLSSDGVLTVTAPKPAIEDKSNERHVQIQQTGPAHLNVKENPTDEKDGKEKDKKEKKDKK